MLAAFGFWLIGTGPSFSSAKDVLLKDGTDDLHQMIPQIFMALAVMPSDQCRLHTHYAPPPGTMEYICLL